MKLKKNVKKIIIVVIIMLLAGAAAYLGYKSLKNSEKEKEVKVIDNISKYGYKLKETKSKEYKKMFNELKEILDAKELDEEKYAKKISEMFVYDFYSLKDKMAKTDVGGVDFVYKEIEPNFLQNAQDTYYKYVESNIYGNRKQNLPEVTNIEIKGYNQKAFAYGNKNDEKAIFVDVIWSYTDEEFSNNQKKATLVFIHDDIKLSLVELD